MSRFSIDWLRLRESADLAARDPALARRFAAALAVRGAQPLQLLDLGAGTGANCRALLPRIAGDQEWLLIERDRDLIAVQGEEFTRWARRQGYPIRAGGGDITIDAGAARWHIVSLPLDLMEGRAAIEALAIDGVAAAALFDLVSEAWVDWFADFLAARAVPLLAALTVDGRRQWQPPWDDDAVVVGSFRAHQARDKGFGPALGGAAPAVLRDTFAAHGFAVAESDSAWRLGAGDGALLAALIEGEAEAATVASPADAAAIAAWRKARLGRLAEHKLGLTIGHCDMLALPV